MVFSDAPVLARPSAPPALPSGPVEVTEAWLRNRRLSEHTRDAYRRDVAGWLAWCAGRDLDPLRATFLARQRVRPRAGGTSPPAAAGR